MYLRGQVWRPKEHSGLVDKARHNESGNQLEAIFVLFHDGCGGWQIYVVVKVAHITKNVVVGKLREEMPKKERKSTIQGLSQLFSSWGYVWCFYKPQSFSMQFAGVSLLSAVIASHLDIVITPFKQKASTCFAHFSVIDIKWKIWWSWDYVGLVSSIALRCNLDRVSKRCD